MRLEQAKRVAEKGDEATRKLDELERMVDRCASLQESHRSDSLNGNKCQGKELSILPPKLTEVNLPHVNPVAQS